MSFLSNVASAALGYAASEISKSHPVRDFVDRNIKSSGKKDLEDLIRDFVKTNYGVYYTDNDIARELHRIAKSFEAYDYRQL